MLPPNIITNTNYAHGGRFGNNFFTGMALHFISEKNRLRNGYKDYDQLQKLGIELYIGEYMYPETVELKDDNFFRFITGDILCKNITIVNNVWCQTTEFAHYLRNYFHTHQDKKNRIMEHNLFKDRYQNNQDVFVHVRLGDIYSRHFSHPYEYYENALNQITFENGYISSDTIDHPICTKLIEKYKLKPIQYDEVETIMFASTCKNVILSTGTFSWMIGLFSYFSHVFYPKIYVPWHGDIFVFEDWKEVDYPSPSTEIQQNTN